MRVVEEDGSHIVQMTIQGKHASSRLVVPHLNAVVVSTAHQQRLCGVKVDSSYRTIMLLQPIIDGACLVIPELYAAVV